MATTKGKRALIYCRVSTKEQVEEGNSLVSQEKLCTEYANKHGYDVASVYIEQGESAKTADRTELKKMLAFCTNRKHNISAIIIYKIDRLSRNTDDYSQIRILLKKYGVEIKSTSEHFEDTPAGRFMENIIANVAQFDNDVRAERSVGGMREAMREGRYVWRATFGYSNVRIDGKATIAPNNDAPLIRRLFEIVAASQKPIEQIRTDINLEQLIMPRNKPVSKTHFFRLLRNETYAGWIRKFGERHRGNFESIVTDELFAKVQSVLNGRHKHQPQRIIQNETFPLRRFFRHESGKALTGCWAQGRRKKYPYYKVNGGRFDIRKEELEKQFVEWLNFLKMDVDHFDTLFESIKRRLGEKASGRKNEQRGIEHKIVKLKDWRSAVVVKNINGVIDDEICKELLDSVNAEIYDLERRIEYSDNPVIDIERVRLMVRKVLFSPGEAWANSPLNERIKLQWFYFPDGIEIRKTCSQTAKICKLFKLKSPFSGVLYPNVPLKAKKSNTNNWQILRIKDTSDVPTIDEIIEEIHRLCTDDDEISIAA